MADASAPAPCFPSYYPPPMPWWNPIWRRCVPGKGLESGALAGTAAETGSAPGDMVMNSESELGLQRVTFSDITETSFTWKSEFSRDGVQWMEVMRVEANRRMQ